MLHEILLSLSGYPSSIWQNVKEGKEGKIGDVNAYTSPAEQSMLLTLARISELHLQLKESSQRLSRSHRSMTCCAVASTVDSVHLAAYRKNVVDVERLILEKDAAYVGGYNIVPLSTIVGEFAPWSRRLEWLSSLMERMGSQSDALKHRTQCTGAELINFLHQEINTGYVDIKDIATQLLMVAQKTWMRDVAIWILYGVRPSIGNQDFCVQTTVSEVGFQLDKHLIPNFVTATAADCLLAIGVAQNRLRQYEISSLENGLDHVDAAKSLSAPHRLMLESLIYPLNTAMFESVMLSINQSMSENALSKVLPTAQVMQLLDVVEQFFLLRNGEFATVLIANADHAVTTRLSHQHTIKPVRKVGILDDLLIKSTELDNILTRCWFELLSRQSDESLEVKTWTAARNLVRLKDAIPHPYLVSTLLPQPSELSLSFPLHSPLHLFLDSADVDTYSNISSFLLSIRRCEIRLSDLWLLTSQRRTHPTPIGPSQSSSTGGKRSLATRRRREQDRDQILRKHWACVSNALLLVNELSAYLHSEVIQNSWRQFTQWVQSANLKPKRSQGTGLRPTSATTNDPVNISGSNSPNLRSSRPDQLSPLPTKDSRILARGHKLFLTQLNRALFLDKSAFISSLKEFLISVDHYVALFPRLQSVWEGLDLQEDDGVLDAFSNFGQDERDVHAEMDRTRITVNDNLTHVMTSIQGIEKDAKAGQDMVEGLQNIDLNSNGADGKFQPWTARTIDRLIMKLDFLSEKTGKGDEMYEDDDFMIDDDA